MKFGIFTSGILVAAFFLLGFGSVSTSAEAKVYLRGDCKKGFSTYKRKRGWKAFALSSSGYACGGSWEHFSRKKAISRALSECYKRGKGCRIYAVAGHAGKVRLGKLCRRTFKIWKAKSGYKVFVISKRTRACNANWNHGSINKAITAAHDKCTSRDCFVYKIGAPRKAIEKWQTDLNVIGLYQGKIDSQWGPGTRSAMKKFARLAKLKNPISGDAFLQLHWAALIKTKFQVSSGKAIEHSGAAVNAKSLADVRKLVKTEVR